MFLIRKIPFIDYSTAVLPDSHRLARGNTSTNGLSMFFYARIIA